MMPYIWLNGHSFILFIQVIFASVTLQLLVRFTSACHVLVYCLFADKDQCVAIAYLLDLCLLPLRRSPKVVATKDNEVTF